MARHFASCGIQAFYALDDSSPRRISKRPIRYDGSYYSLAHGCAPEEVIVFAYYGTQQVMGGIVVEDEIDLIAHRRFVRKSRVITVKAFAVEAGPLECFLNPRRTPR